jgi:hypothetical protein
MLDGPATRPKTPEATENGVGKLAATERRAPNVSTGKRAWRTPKPDLSLLDRKVWQGLFLPHSVVGDSMLLFEVFSESTFRPVCLGGFELCHYSLLHINR